MQLKRKRRASTSKILLRLAGVFLFIVFSFAFLVLSGIGVFGLAIECPRARRAYNDTMAMLAAKQEIANEQLQERQYTQSFSPADINSYRHASQMHVTGIGDSVMVAAVEELYSQFPNGYFDASYNRTIQDGLQALIRLESSQRLGDVIVISFSNICEISEDTCKEIMSHTQGKPVFWILSQKPGNNESLIERLMEEYPNAYAVDWRSVADLHKEEYILPNSLHPSQAGCEAYASLIDMAITQDLLGYTSSTAGISR